MKTATGQHCIANVDSGGHVCEVLATFKNPLEVDPDYDLMMSGEIATTDDADLNDQPDAEGLDWSDRTDADFENLSNSLTLEDSADIIHDAIEKGFPVSKLGGFFIYWLYNQIAFASRELSGD